MNLTIPYQTLEVGRIHMNPFQRDAKGRSISHLLYNDSTVNMNDFILNFEENLDKKKKLRKKGLEKFIEEEEPVDEDSDTRG